MLHDYAIIIFQQSIHTLDIELY